MNAYQKIDWVSWTVPLQSKISGAGGASHRVATALIGQHLSWAAEKISELSWGDFGSGRAPYQSRLHFKDLGLTVFFGGEANHMLYELSGTGCEVFTALDLMQPLLTTYGERVTRLDIAADFESDTQPTDFAAMRDGARFKSGAIMNSEAGQTVYVGSAKSDRFARVYRYAPPHPRSHLLRCEMVLRGDQAKQAVQFLENNSLERLCGAVGAVFGWKHPDWIGSQWQGEALSAFRPQRHMGATTRWLVTQVLPAVEKLINEGHREDARYFYEQIGHLLNKHVE